MQGYHRAVRGNAAIPRRSGGSASVECCSLWPAVWPDKGRVDAAARGAHVRGAFRRGSLPQCRRPGVIGVPASLATPGDSPILFVATRANGRARCGPAASCGSVSMAGGRAPIAAVFLFVYRGRPGRILCRRPTPESWALWVKHGKEPSQRVPPSASSECSSRWEQLRVCRSRCLSLASATSVAARDIAAVFLYGPGVAGRTEQSPPLFSRAGLTLGKLK